MKTQSRNAKPLKAYSLEYENTRLSVGSPGHNGSEADNPTVERPSPSDPMGGQTTISPPAKVKLDESVQVLASNIDTLYLAIDTYWQSDELFKQLTALKSIAAQMDCEQSIVLKDQTHGDGWIFAIFPFGVKGYEWFLRNNDYALKIGNWEEPQSRPSIMVEIRSEALWSMGPKKAVERVADLIQGQQGRIITMSPSRADLCVDLLIPEDLWTEDLSKFKVTRACYEAKHVHNQSLTGISIGKGAISARLYDKPLEIIQKKNKEWMFHIWKLNEVPDGKKIIRVEFQLRRETLKSLGFRTIAEFFSNYQRAWAYCTQKWLKFQDNPGKHHTQRQTLAWWEIVQNGFMGFQAPEPLVRLKAISQDKKQLACQAYGLLTSLHAIKKLEWKIESEPTELKDVLLTFIREITRAQKDGEDLNREIQKKIAKYYRDIETQDFADGDRKQKNPGGSKKAKKGPSP